MSTISLNLRATILSLKQISDRLKLLITNSSSKVDVKNAKDSILDAIGVIQNSIGTTSDTSSLDTIFGKIADLKEDISEIEPGAGSLNASVSNNNLIIGLS